MVLQAAAPSHAKDSASVVGRDRVFPAVTETWTETDSKGQISTVVAYPPDPVTNLHRFENTLHRDRTNGNRTGNDRPDTSQARSYLPTGGSILRDTDWGYSFTPEPGFGFGVRLSDYLNIFAATEDFNGMLLPPSGLPDGAPAAPREAPDPESGKNGKTDGTKCGNPVVVQTGNKIESEFDFGRHGRHVRAEVDHRC
jgi:hypothetical protein